MDDRGKVKLFLFGFLLCVWLVNIDEVGVFVDCKKLDGVVEK